MNHVKKYFWQYKRHFFFYQTAVCTKPCWFIIICVKILGGNRTRAWHSKGWYSKALFSLVVAVECGGIHVLRFSSSCRQSAAGTFCLCFCDLRRPCYEAQWSVTKMKNGGDSERRNSKDELTWLSNCGKKSRGMEVKEREMKWEWVMKLRLWVCILYKIQLLGLRAVK